MKRISQLRDDARQIFNAALNAADAAAAVARHVRVTGDILNINGRSYPLKQYRKIIVVGAGKGSAQMFCPLAGLLGNRNYGGIIIVKEGYSVPIRKIEIIEAGHPVPDEYGLRATEKLIGLLKQATSEDLVICLISGGGSALLSSPADGVSFHEKQELTRVLLGCGAPIREINAIRKHVSKVKGGRLAAVAYPAVLISLILSDVVGDSVSTIASGPTAPDLSTFSECQFILDRYDLRKKVSPSIAKLIEQGSEGKIAETPKPGDPIFENVLHVIVGDNRLALSAAEQQAELLGYSVSVLDDFAEGEAVSIAMGHVALAKQIHLRNAPLPACIISGGEATVTLRGDGLGGRNQEFALAAAIEIDGLNDVVALSGGTDGTDGPTDAAGGIVDGGTVRRGQDQGLNAREYLTRNNSYRFLRATGDLLITGPTFTNVMDLRLMLIG